MLKYHNYDIVFQEIPDEITLAINITGCKNSCYNCHSKHLQKDAGEELTIKLLEQLLAKYDHRISCICFMGGDHNPKQIDSLARFIKTITCNRIKTAWYSGKNSLPDEIQPMNFNYIKLGAYNDTLGGLKLRSTNQRLYKISDGRLDNITEKFWGK